MVADYTVKTGMLGKEGPSALELDRSGLMWLPFFTLEVATAAAATMGFLEWQVVVEMAMAREMGMHGGYRGYSKMMNDEVCIMMDELGQ